MVASVRQESDSVKRQKSEAQIYLEQVEKQECIIKNKMIERQQWMDIALGITANMDGERVQSSGTQSKMADAVAKCVDMEAEINAHIDKLIDIKKDVTQTIEAVHSATEYMILHMRYIQYIPLKVIATKWDEEYTNITTAHGRALRSVQRILEERKNDEV